MGTREKLHESELEWVGQRVISGGPKIGITAKERRNSGAAQGEGGQIPGRIEIARQETVAKSFRAPGSAGTEVDREWVFEVNGVEWASVDGILNAIIIVGEAA